MPLHKRVEIAFKIAVAKAIEEQRGWGLPVYVWRDGEVVELSPDEVRGGLRNRKGSRHA